MSVTRSVLTWKFFYILWIILPKPNDHIRWNTHWVNDEKQKCGRERCTYEIIPTSHGFSLYVKLQRWVFSRWHCEVRCFSGRWLRTQLSKLSTFERILGNGNPYLETFLMTKTEESHFIFCCVMNAGAVRSKYRWNTLSDGCSMVVEEGYESVAHASISDEEYTPPPPPKRNPNLQRMIVWLFTCKAPRSMMFLLVQRSNLQIQVLNK